MKTNNTFILFVILLSQVVLGQSVDSKRMQGKVSFDTVLVEGVNVVNLMTNKSTASDKEGVFFLFVKEGDILVFSAVNLVTLRKVVNKQDLLANVLSIQMTAQSVELKEVVINQSTQITAENLGIIPFGQKKYTAAERKLYTATSGGGIDGLLNSISGRKAMLKKEVAVEYKEQMLVRLDYLFLPEYYTETLNIPQEYIRGFQYYCVEDTDLVASLNSRNKTLSQFLIITLAKKYNKTIANEN
ncbi:hypothetical protein QO200_02335 [Flavobacterium sp. Arc3]|uniref:hypothetical protein n=1 Tax=unclassified Flavobacterium TaxID=196869 RepID=UPI00352FDB3D